MPSCLSEKLPFYLGKWATTRESKKSVEFWILHPRIGLMLLIVTDSLKQTISRSPLLRVGACDEPGTLRDFCFERGKTTWGNALDVRMKPS